MTLLRYRGSIKSLRETLCRAQTAIPHVFEDDSFTRSDLHKLQELIGEIDRHRPLGPDGKHGNRHTRTCGCDEQLSGGWSSGDQLDAIARWLERKDNGELRLHRTGPQHYVAELHYTHGPMECPHVAGSTGGPSPYEAVQSLIEWLRIPHPGQEWLDGPDPGSFAVSGGLRDEQQVTADDGISVTEIPVSEILEQDRGKP